MTDRALKTLFHCFEAEAVPLPGNGARVLFLGAEPGFVLPAGWAAGLHAVQGFRPAFRALSDAGQSVFPRAEGDGYDMALVLAGRSRGWNQMQVAEAVARTVPNAPIVVAGEKSAGIAPLLSRVSASIGVGGSLAKYHGLVFWFSSPQDRSAADTLRSTARPATVEGGFATASGMFSSAGIDPGSRLLAENLPGDIAGHVADFGAGWGYLAGEVVRRAPGIARLDLYEADFDALDMARANLAGVARSGIAVGFHWLDLPREAAARAYDFIVMNPPFHEGRAAEPRIGQDMIRAAVRALRRGGRLWLVANRGLPYEAVLAEAFAAQGEVCRDGSFKVLWARR